MNLVKHKLYAFWRHADFPYVLGGPVEEMNENGSVRPTNYGGYWFKPFKILPLKTGLALQQHLDKMRRDFEKAEKEFKHHWKTEGDKLFKMVEDGTG